MQKRRVPRCLCLGAGLILLLGGLALTVGAQVTEGASPKTESAPDAKAIEASWHTFVHKMVARDLDGAAAYVTESERERFKRESGAAGMDKVSAWYRTVRDFKLMTATPGGIDFFFRITMDRGEEYKACVSFVPDPDGVWRIRGIAYSGVDPG